MDWLLYVVIAVLIVMFFVAKKPTPKDTPRKENIPLPYKKRDDFLSASELSFYRTLSTYLENSAIICPKVAVKEIVFIGKGTGKDYIKFFNFIAKKHVDFVLCDVNTMQVICAIELDDKSHQKEARKQRDTFLDRVFDVAQIPLIHIKAQSGYSRENIKEILDCFESINSGKTDLSSEIKDKSNIVPEENNIPTCPKCGIPMIKRKVTQGANSGMEFYGCTNYPQCREIKKS